MSYPVEYANIHLQEPEGSCPRMFNAHCMHCNNDEDPLGALSDDSALIDIDAAAQYTPQALMRTRISQLEGHIYALKKRHNAFSLIYRRLPPEILRQVFAHIRPTRRRDIRIAHVSPKAWRSILLSTPSFWADLLSLVVPRSYIPEPSPWFSIFFQRSAVGPFALQLPYFSSRYATSSRLICIESLSSMSTYPLLRPGPFLTWWTVICHLFVAFQSTMRP
ncbi:hypothetical protein PYCCODRAFT_523291 [Trametes coccinea BRFM310]|uniref:F-box domain-containing protein n=1 Tax=Trametes coccinea (strain BRFM310) TaxID=1353009 RepID=A0A1Y2ILL2_TRAC3|nr:hypothetical protein PYCCODRAFT_523291 [Trametes coccinea BRFM310]